jgi:NhaP-type Na+/H+ or K+/H+ antiporter
VLFALLIARRASILMSFVGIPLGRTEKLFIAWFGPKGIASMLFALFVLNSTAPARSLAFDLAAFTILASTVAHGLTDTVGGPLGRATDAARMTVPRRPRRHASAVRARAGLSVDGHRRAGAPRPRSVVGLRPRVVF